MKRFALMLACASLSQPIFAAQMVLQPIQVGPETVRFFQGTPTIDLQMPSGAIQVTPLPMDHGSLAFSLVVLNGSQAAANIGVENVSFTVGQEAGRVLSAKELIKKAETRAAWSAVGLALLGAAATAASANNQTHYRSFTRTPFGTYSTWASYRSSADQLQTAALAAGTVAGVYAIQSQLDRTREALGNDVVQTTTVDPGDSYAGKIILTKVKAKAPFRVDLVVDWNGTKYPLSWQFVKDGTPAPVFKALTPVSSPTQRSMPLATPIVSPAVIPTATLTTTTGAN